MFIFDTMLPFHSQQVFYILSIMYIFYILESIYTTYNLLATYDLKAKLLQWTGHVIRIALIVESVIFVEAASKAANQWKTKKLMAR